MKKLFAILAIAGALTACNSSSDTTTSTDSTTTTDSMTTVPDTLSAPVTVDTTTVTVDSAKADSAK